jgi:hypothetical protein
MGNYLNLMKRQQDNDDPSRSYRSLDCARSSRCNNREFGYVARKVDTRFDGVFRTATSA